MWNFDFDLKFNSSLQFYFRLAFTSFGNLFSTTIQFVNPIYSYFVYGVILFTLSLNLLYI